MDDQPKKREKPICYVTMFVLADRTIMPTTYTAFGVVKDGGITYTGPYYFWDAPATEFDWRDATALQAALTAEIEKGKIVVPEPDDPTWKTAKYRSFLEKATNSRSAKDFEKKSVMISVLIWSDRYEIESQEKAFANGVYCDLIRPAQVERSKGVAGLAAAIQEHLTGRTDLPKLLKKGTAKVKS